jgi:hypothetical protein
MNLILDFDHTLFDAEEFKQALRDRFSLFGISSDQFDTSYLSIKEELGFYNYQEHMKNLAQQNDLDENDLLTSFQEIIDTAKEFLYSDTISFLHAVKKIPNSSIYLFTFGQDRFQTAKIEASGIKDYFNEIVDTTDSKVDLIEIGEKASDTVLVNDRGSEIDEIKQKFPQARAVWLRRPYSLYFNETSQQKDYEATNLSEALSFIKNFIEK